MAVLHMGGTHEKMYPHSLDDEVPDFNIFYTEVPLPPSPPPVGISALAEKKFSYWLILCLVSYFNGERNSSMKCSFFKQGTRAGTQKTISMHAVHEHMVT